MLRALTLHRPWDQLIALGLKKAENRTWPPGFENLGTWIAIHSGCTFDKDGERWALSLLKPEEQLEYLFAPETKPKHIVALALLDSVVDVERPASAARMPADQRRWKNGDRFAWLFSAVERLADPVHCSGRLGLWRVPKDLEANIRRQVPAYVNEMIGSRLPTLPGIAR